MLSKRQISLIRSLHLPKYREQLGLFLAEGDTLVRDLLGTELECFIIAGSSDWIEKQGSLFQGINAIAIDATLMKKMSGLHTPSPVLAVFYQPRLKTISEEIPSGPVLYLDGIRDPGNMGTIIRTADWFGIKEVAFSPDSVDPFNPKVVQASMGSLARMDLRCLDPESYFPLLDPKRQVMGAMMEGKGIHDMVIPKDPVLVIGNEAQGIRPHVKPWIHMAVAIPKYHKTSRVGSSAESLNAAMAAGILMAVIRQQEVNTSEF